MDAGEMPKDDSGGRDFEKIFDLNRSTLTSSMVQRMEECMRAAKVAADDLKEVVAECVEREFKPLDIAAMKKHAKLRLQDKVGAAREQLEALHRIGKAIKIDLFDWAELGK
jgi:uncharacterized protein (UPF0335 family)